MRYRKLTADGDYSFGNGQLDFFRDEPAAVGQACETRLELWLGEFFLDINEGTPYMQGILGKHSKAVADLTIQDRVIGTQGLTKVKNFESTVDGDTRAMTVTFSIDTIYGPGTVELQNYGNY